MSFSRVHAAQITGLHAQIIDVETDLSKGMNAFTVVGLPDKAVDEARDRIGAAIKNSGFKSPKQLNQKTVISLAPAHIKKEGPLFDLSMSLAYLLSTGNISFNPDKKIFLGELSLDGALRPITGVLLLATAAQKAGFTEMFLPQENAREAALIKELTVFGAKTLAEVIEHLDEKEGKDPNKKKQLLKKQEQTVPIPQDTATLVDFSDIAGQETAKRALEIAAAGGHNIALFGPPGTGKTLLAKAFPAILPPLTFDAMLETTGIHSVARKLKGDFIVTPPLRSPHHTSSYVSLVGGGSPPRPGEVTFAHNGVLFLDEFPEFDKKSIETLRQPLEDREIHIARAKGTECFPANFILIAAMNPCPCGNYGSEKECVCPPLALMKYQQKISGPIVDRIDLWVEVGHIPHKALMGNAQHGDTTKTIKQRVARARKIQRERFMSHKKTYYTNSELNVADMKKIITLSEQVQNILQTAAVKLDLSPRAYHRIIKIARTIADLDGSAEITEGHILEALQYRHTKH